MVDVPKTGEKPAELTNNTVIMSSPQVKPEDVIIEHEGVAEGAPVEAAPVVRKQKDDPIAEIRAKQESTERALADEREKRISAERERDAARAHADTTKANLVKSENEKVATQEAAILSKVEAAKAEVENAERALEEAIDTGKPAKEQITLQKRLAEAVYKQKGAEGAKAHFDTWKENQKNKPAVGSEPQKTSQYSTVAQRWINARPLFKKDKHYKRLAEGAALEAENDGIKPDSDAYFKAIEDALREAGMNPDPHQDESSPSATPSTPVSRANRSGTSTAAPVSQNSTAAGANGGTAAEEHRQGRRVFKLDGNMRDQAIKIYGKNSTFKLSDEDAYARYAARQLEIRDKRKNGERI